MAKRRRRRDINVLAQCVVCHSVNHWEHATVRPRSLCCQFCGGRLEILLVNKQPYRGAQPRGS